MVSAAFAKTMHHALHVRITKIGMCVRHPTSKSLNFSGHGVQQHAIAIKNDQINRVHRASKFQIHTLLMPGIIGTDKSRLRFFPSPHRISH
ncbi:MAG TPA: hypothetical protein DD423_05060 [Opitutae bacterium]|nr:hypothetical protein [Opitutae bacterium]